VRGPRRHGPRSAPSPGARSTKLVDAPRLRSPDEGLTVLVPWRATPLDSKSSFAAKFCGRLVSPHFDDRTCSTAALPVVVPRYLPPPPPPVIQQDVLALRFDTHELLALRRSMRTRAAVLSFVPEVIEGSRDGRVAVMRAPFRFAFSISCTTAAGLSTTVPSRVLTPARPRWISLALSSRPQRVR